MEKQTPTPYTKILILFLKNAAYIMHTYAQKDRKKRDKDGESDISE